MEKLTYTEVNVYKIPVLEMPDDSLPEEVHIGIWGQRRLEYLKNHKSTLYSSLLMSGKLRAHLHEIDTTAFERRELIIKRMMKAQNVTEQLKSENPMLWIGKVNNIRNCVDEIIRNELIYE